MNLRKLGIKKQKVLDHIYLLDFKDPLELSKTFLRFQEHYESPKYRGKTFTLKEFKAWYSEAFGEGRFTYHYDWNGFNIPSYVLKAFYEIFKSVEEPFYVIGVSKGDKTTIQHETAHGLFYTNEAYKAKVLKVLDSLDLSKFKKELRHLGYCNAVLLDEINAYMLDNRKSFGKADLSAEPYQSAMKRLKRLFVKYSK
jgi:hypothetical protein